MKGKKEIEQDVEINLVAKRDSSRRGTYYFLLKIRP